MLAVKNNLNFIFVFILFTLFSWSQESSRLLVSKDSISISKHVNSSGKIVVYKGQLSESELQTATPILGTTLEKKKSIYFVPLIPFAWEQKYTVVFDNALDYFEIAIPEDYKQLAIEAIYPSAKKLPSNLLKWYIQFSKPINEVNAYSNMHFVDSSGDTISRAILQLENALISEDMQLLTVWIEPGRQKRGLIPNQQLGAVFEKGKEYSLLISKNLKDQNGISMKQNHKYDFAISEADRHQPNIKSWNISSPTVDTTSGLIIDLKEPMDYGSTLDRITIINSEKKKITGNLRLIENETTLVFKPQQKWIKGDYQILVDARIEDLAGNNLNRLFDSKIKDTIPSNFNATTRVLTFSIK